MNGPTSAFTVAARMVDIGTLSPQQMTQLRALDHKYQQALFTMLDGAQRAPTSAEISALDDMAARDIVEVLTRGHPTAT